MSKWETNQQKWEARFQDLVEYKRAHGNCNVSRHHKANPQLGIWVYNQRPKKETMSEERQKRLDSIGFVWKGRATPISVPWEVRFKQLVEYKRVHGNCNVSRHHKANPQLGIWVYNQRPKKETMSEQRRKRLDSIGFVWKGQATPISVPWEVRFQQLVEYKRAHGNCNVPKGYKANPQLGIWVYNQRPKKETMSEERRKRLDSIGFVWGKGQATPISVPWEVRFQQLVEYKRAHGNCNVPKGYKANPQLGIWVYNQRPKKETMSEERRKRLNSIGFVWKGQATPISVPWEVRFQQLVEYKRAHGNCNVPKGYKANPQLGIWVYNQRPKKETMSEERRKRLNSIGFVWKGRATPISVPWEVRFQQLEEYKRAHGNCNVPKGYKANPQLGLWVNKQGRKKETMSEERRKRLDSIGFVWKGRATPISVDWEVRFQQLVEYKRVHGNCNVSSLDKANPQLGIWVYNQRRKKETMSEKRRNMLDSIGFVWSLKTGRPKQQPRVRPSTMEDPKKKKARLDEEAAQEDTVYGQQGWDSYFEQLRDFVRKYNHCNVPAQHPELGRWAEEQQQLYERKQIGRGRESNLTDAQEAKLMAVGFVFVRTLNIPDDDDDDDDIYSI